MQKKIRTVLLVVPVHNRPNEINLLLRSLSNLNCSNVCLRISIIDDGSNRAVKAQLDASITSSWEIDFYYNHTPMGPGYCRNLASRSFEGDYIWYLDSDTEIIEPQCLQYMLRAFEEDNSLGGAGGTLEPFANGKRIVVWKSYFNFIGRPEVSQFSDFKRQYVGHIATSNLMIRNSVFKMTQGFRTDLLREEDYVLCLEIKGKGYHFLQDSKMAVWHYVSSVGRTTGHFSFFRCRREYYRSLLETRIVIMGLHARKRLLILPFLDCLILLLIATKMISGNYQPSRIDRISSKKYTSFFEKRQFAIIICQEAVRSYFLGYKLLGNLIFNKLRKFV